jgi:hypothetical protein
VTAVDNFDTTKFLANELAKNLRGRNAAMILALMQRLRSISDSRKIARSSPPIEGDIVGIWKRGEDGDWRRRIECRDEWRFWADVDRIPAKSAGRTRILLVGESVARGYFFDPIVTPARLLQSRLDAAHPGRFEAVDLARIDIDQFGVMNLLTEAERLEPDFVIYWGGNNWVNRGELKSRHTDRLLAELDRYYEECHRLYLETLLPETAERITRRVAEMAGPQRALMIVPDWNLRHWRSEPEAALPFLPGDRHRRWRSLREDAERALGEGALARALEAASAMGAIDGGSGWDTYEIRARIALKQGRSAVARRELERARDALVGLPIPTSPRCPSSVQEALKRTAAASGMRVFDQREKFYAEAGELYFMDYCHLSKAGLIDTVEEMFLHIVDAFGLGNVTAQPLTFEFPAREEASAHLLAAVHNAHYGQSDVEIERHVRKAVEIFPQIRDEIRLLLDFINRRSPRWMCESFDRLSRSPVMSRYLHPRNPNELDKFEESRLDRALLNVLEEDEEEMRRLDDLMVVQHYDPVNGVDLLDYQYRAPTFRSRVGYSLSSRTAFFRSCEQVSRFRLIAPAVSGARIMLRLTYRLASDSVDGCGPEVNIDGHRVATLASSRAWTSVDIDVPGQALIGSTHEVTIHWPEQDFDWESHRGDIEYCLNSGTVANALPVFGEIFRFRASFDRGHDPGAEHEPISLFRERLYDSRPE